MSEVTSFLGGPDGLEGLLVLGEAGSGSLGTLSSEILWGVLLLFPLILGSRSLLLVQNGESLSDGLSDNL